MYEFAKEMTLTLDDLIDYNVTYGKKIYRITERFVFWIFPVITLGMGIGFYVDPKFEDKTGAVIMGILLFGFSFLVSLLLRFICRKLTAFRICSFSKKVLKKSEPDYCLRLTEQGLESKTKKTSYFCVWQQIVKVTENEKALYLFLNKRVAFVISKRYLNSVEELTELKTFISQKSGNEIQYLSLDK